MTFTLKDIIMLIGIAIPIVSGFLSLQNEVSTLKKEVATLKVANQSYIGLPADVKTMKEDMEKYGALTETIYFGLLAEGIIKPPQ